jgi:hypothetical protein
MAQLCVSYRGLQQREELYNPVTLLILDDEPLENFALTRRTGHPRCRFPRHLVQHFIVGSAGAFHHVKRMVASFNNYQFRALAHVATQGI